MRKGNISGDTDVSFAFASAILLGYSAADFSELATCWVA